MFSYNMDGEALCEVCDRAFKEPDQLLSHHIACHVEAGLEKTRIKKNKPGGFFRVFWFFFAQKREFIGFFQFREYFQVHPDFKL
jgi:hypothetical protein